MKAYLVIVGIVLGAVLISVLASAQDKPGAAEYRLSGPYTHANLTIFLIHGQDTLKGKQFLTLQEALEQKKVIVHETGDVNTLSVENVGEIDVYIQSGDIVKGGKQDRTISMDFIAPARSGRMPIDAFCVENGRWTARGSEPTASFAASNDALAGKDVKMAAKAQRNQSAVWENVARSQARLSDNVGQNVAAGASPSSYQLTMENAALQKGTEPYIKELGSAVEGKDDVIGYAFCINGKVNSADVYASNALFRKLWPKLIKSSSVEAIAELEQGKTFAPATPDSVRKCMADAAQGKSSERKITDRVKVVETDAAPAVMFETRDKELDGQWLHRNYVAK